MMEDHDFFTKEEALGLFKRITIDLIKQERKHISKAAENGRYKVVIHYELTAEQMQLLGDLGFTVVSRYEDECYISTITWDTPQKPKVEIFDMDKESIGAFNAIKMYERTKEVNAATLREVKRIITIITPLIKRDAIASDSIILNKELSNKISMSSEVRAMIMEAGFELDTDYHGRYTICWSKLKAEVRQQQEDEDGQSKNK